MSVLSQREVSITQLTATRASGAVVLIRFYVGLIFVGEGILKFLRPETLGPGRFEKSGIPASTLLANLDGVFEIGCGILILVGLLTRLATLPMIIDMVGALTITKLPLLWGHAPLYPKEGGFWDFLHEGRLEIAMLCGSVFLLIVGAGGYSLDQRMNRVPTPAHVSGAAV
jgi:putative oxidoreductase